MTAPQSNRHAPRDATDREDNTAWQETLLLADRSAMDHILEAIRKIRAYSAELAKKA